MSDDDNSSRMVAQTTQGPVRPEPEEWVHRYGDFLFRHAQARVGQREVAEDLVQDVFVAAWKSRERFAGKASEKTWLLRILRNKIVDYYRRRRSEMEMTDVEELQQFEEKQFHSGWRGTHWSKGVAPRVWANPRQSLERLEFWKVVYECTGKLPGTTARVFLLREVEDMSSDEICRELNIKPSHLFVLTHRARLALRRCLELNWFRNERSKTSDATWSMPAALFISCAEAARRISRMQDAPLSRRARLGLLLHLATCRLCRRFRRQTRFILTVFQSFDTHVDEVSAQGLSPQAKARIVVRMREES